MNRSHCHAYPLPDLQPLGAGAQCVDDAYDLVSGHDGHLRLRQIPFDDVQIGCGRWRSIARVTALRPALGSGISRSTSSSGEESIGAIWLSCMAFHASIIRKMASGGREPPVGFTPLSALERKGGRRRRGWGGSCSGRE